jgi:hypothetical protein
MFVSEWFLMAVGMLGIAIGFWVTAKAFDYFEHRKYIVKEEVDDDEN